MRSLICVWLTPPSSYSTGSSSVMMFCASPARCPRKPYRVEVLPEPVGPVISHQPLGALDGAQHQGQRRVVEAHVVQGHPIGPLAEQADHDGLAVQRRQRRDTQVDLLPAGSEGGASVLGTPALGDVHRRHELQPRDQGARLRARHAHDLLEDAVDAAADGGLGGAGLDVDVLAAQRQDPVAFGDLGRDAGGDGVVDLQTALLDVLQPQLVGERAGDRLLGDDAQPDDRLSEPLAPPVRRQLVLQRVGELAFVEDALLEQQFPQPAPERQAGVGAHGGAAVRGGEYASVAISD